MKLFIQIQLIHKISYKFLRNRELHNIIILIDAESFHVSTEIEQLYQAAGSIFFRSQDSLKFKSLKHRFMYGINSTGKDSGNLFLLQ